MESVKQELVYVDAVNCARDGCKYYRLKGGKYFRENGTDCSSKR
jgi:hypothetical protein